MTCSTRTPTRLVRSSRASAAGLMPLITVLRGPEAASPAATLHPNVARSGITPPHVRAANSVVRREPEPSDHVDGDASGVCRSRSM